MITPSQLPEKGQEDGLIQMLKILESSQWQPPEAIHARQLSMLRKLLSHHARHSLWVKNRVEQSGLPIDALTESLATWSRLPVMTRRDLQQMDWDEGHLPKAHEPVFEKKSSGSTGEPVTVRRTAISEVFWQANTLRDHQWHRRDASGTLLAIRANFTKAVTSRSWGPPVAKLYQTGPSFGLSSTTDVNQIIRRIKEVQPHHLLIYPSIWRSILDVSNADSPAWKNLVHVRTLGETVDEELRSRTIEVTGATLIDVYSAEEVGVIALQCPDSAAYHVMAESLLVEIINDSGELCQPGEVGRVVVTDLSNLATPILRYENGDYAEVGAQCGCGRGLPTLRRVVGRQRNMVKLPDGRRHWPLTGYREFQTIADVRQYQLVQNSTEEIEVRLVVREGKLAPSQEQRLTEIVTREIGHSFRYKFTYFPDQIPRHKSGKFEEFICSI